MSDTDTGVPKNFFKVCLPNYLGSTRKLNRVHHLKYIVYIYIRLSQAAQMYKSRDINHNFFAIKTRPQRFAAPLSSLMAWESETVWCRVPAVSVAFAPGSPTSSKERGKKIQTQGFLNLPALRP